MAADILTALDANLPVSNSEVLRHFGARRAPRTTRLGMRCFPHRHRVMGFLLALPIVAILIVVVFLGITMLAAHFGAGRGLVAMFINLLVLPSIAAVLLRPISRWLERRLIRWASRALPSGHAANSNRRPEEHDP